MYKIKFTNVLKNTNILGITIFPFIFLSSSRKNKDNSILINHERIHIVQQLELLIVPFFILYFLNYIINLFKYRFNHRKAYYYIMFEQEAYNNEDNLDYLKNRKPFNYLRKK